MSHPPQSMGTPRMLPINGIHLAVWDAGQGFPVVFCHGFPELAFSWRHQLPALAAAGYRAIAPDQRGYGLSDRPAAVTDYDVTHLTDDLAGLLDALGLERAVFCGHDWGGIVVWHMAMLHPDRVAGVIALNTPFQARGQRDLVSTLRHVFGEQHYMVAFQQPNLPEAMFEQDVARVLGRMFRKPKSGNAVNLPPEQAARMLTLDALTGSGPSGGTPFLTPEDFQFYVDTFRATGFTGGINWYRNLRRNWEMMEHVRQQIDVPALMVSAEHDLFLPPRLTEGMERWVPKVERQVVRDCGHWTQQEQPERVNALMVDWLRRWFRPVQGLQLRARKG